MRRSPECFYIGEMGCTELGERRKTGQQTLECSYSLGLYGCTNVKRVQDLHVFCWLRQHFRNVHRRGISMSVNCTVPRGNRQQSRKGFRSDGRNLTTRSAFLLCSPLVAGTHTCCSSLCRTRYLRTDGTCCARRADRIDADRPGSWYLFCLWPRPCDFSSITMKQGGR